MVKNSRRKSRHNRQLRSLAISLVTAKYLGPALQNAILIVLLVQWTGRTFEGRRGTTWHFWVPRSFREITSRRSSRIPRQIHPDPAGFSQFHANYRRKMRLTLCNEIRFMRDFWYSRNANRFAEKLVSFSATESNTARFRIARSRYSEDVWCHSHDNLWLISFSLKMLYCTRNLYMHTEWGNNCCYFKYLRNIGIGEKCIEHKSHW